MYNSMARHYDELTSDVPYGCFVDFIVKIFTKNKTDPKLILDLGCGTGSISMLLAQKGYEIIGADMSQEMLSIAEEKARGMENKPVFICQSMTGLDLYGTVDAAISCLDSINYLYKPEMLNKAFAGVAMFLNIGGLFIFDVNTEKKLSELNDTTYTRETENVFCSWQTDWNNKNKTAIFTVDLFEMVDKSIYRRNTEIHKERAYSEAEIEEALNNNGLKLLNIYGELKFRKPAVDENRVFYVTVK